MLVKSWKTYAEVPDWSVWFFLRKKQFTFQNLCFFACQLHITDYTDPDILAYIIDTERIPFNLQVQRVNKQI